jgi:hypothetical protein
MGRGTGVSYLNYKRKMPLEDIPYPSFEKQKLKMLRAYCLLKRGGK